MTNVTATTSTRFVTSADGTATAYDVTVTGTGRRRGRGRAALTWIGATTSRVDFVDEAPARASALGPRWRGRVAVA